MSPRVPEVDVSQLEAGAQPASYLLDVREDDEWDAGHVDGAQHIPLMQVPTRLDEIPADTRVMVICRSGSRSAQATAFLVRHGVDAVNVTGGMKSWEAAGRPIIATSPGQPPQVI